MATFNYLNIFILFLKILYLVTVAKALKNFAGMLEFHYLMLYDIMLWTFFHFSAVLGFLIFSSKSWLHL